MGLGDGADGAGIGLDDGVPGDHPIRGTGDAPLLGLTIKSGVGAFAGCAKGDGIPD